MWNIIKEQIVTRWAKDVSPDSPLPEYPRPQLRRERWKSLNGLWDFTIIDKEKITIENFDGKILVPFPVESALSGVVQQLKPTQKLWYHRTFKIPKDWRNHRIILHFGAVDWEATMWINGKKVGVHMGGYTPFSFEISDYIDFSQINEIVVAVWDPTEKGGQEHGKQALEPQEIWYTAVSGIWQTVWLEPVPKIYIQDIKMNSDIEEGLLELSVFLNDQSERYEIRVEIKDGGNIIESMTSNKKKMVLKIPSSKLWSPENPFLYDLSIALKSNNEIIDEVESYFGLRKVSLGNKINGIRTIQLNNKNIFQYGTLDQGYWPDGLYTAPTDEALRYDIEITKELGFNMIRKHVKVEPARWYYYCDKIGILVWQDMPNGGGYYVGDLPPNIDEHKDIREESSKRSYYKELKSMINALFNHPSLITWVPFNEGWGQFDTKKVVNFVRSLDSSRLIDAASGWFDYGVGDILDLHSYPNPIKPKKDKVGSRAAIVGEFGGLGLEVENHMWEVDERFVYRKMRTREKFMKRYDKLTQKLKPLIQEGLSAAIYTQITDVEGEVNGLLTYDREILKLDKETLRELNLSLY